GGAVVLHELWHAARQDLRGVGEGVDGDAGALRGLGGGARADLVDDAEVADRVGAGEHDVAAADDGGDGRVHGEGDAYTRGGEGGGEGAALEVGPALEAHHIERAALGGLEQRRAHG